MFCTSACRYININYLTNLAWNELVERDDGDATRTLCVLLATFPAPEIDYFDLFTIGKSSFLPLIKNERFMLNVKYLRINHFLMSWIERNWEHKDWISLKKKSVFKSEEQEVYRELIYIYIFPKP